MKKIYGTFDVEMRAYGQKLVRNWTSSFAHTQVTVTVFKTSRHSKLFFSRKKQRTMERKKRSKGREWESCCVKKIYGTLGIEMRAYGQKFVTFCKHTDIHTRLNQTFHWGWPLAFELCVIIARTQKHTDRQRHKANDPSELPGWYKAIEI